MGVRDPGVGTFDATREQAFFLGCKCPESKCTIDMQPGIRAIASIGEFIEGVEGAAVDVPRLRTDEGRPIEFLDPIDAYPTLRVGGKLADPVATEAEHGQRLADGWVGFGGDNDSNRRGTEETVGFDIPARSCQQSMSRRRERRKIREGSARGQRARGRLGNPEEGSQPAQHRVFEHDSRRRGRERECILIPGTREPIGGQGDRQRATVHETKESGTGARHGRRRTQLIEFSKHIEGIARSIRKRYVELLLQALDRRGLGFNSPIGQCLEEMSSAAQGLAEQLTIQNCTLHNSLILSYN